MKKLLSTYFKILTSLVSSAVLVIYSAGCHQKSQVLVGFDSRTAPAIVSLAKRQSKTVVNLPPTLSYSSFTGRAYVTHSDYGDTVYIFVPSWVGHNEHYTSDDEWVEGYLYASKPFVWRHGEDHFIDLNVPQFDEPSKARRNTGFQNIQMEVGDPIAKNWYQADSFG